MNSALAIGFATTAATLLVTVTLFTIVRILARRDARRELKRQLVERVLDALDSTTRAMIRPAFVQAWISPQLEFTLLTPRILLDLQGRDRVIAAWVQRRIQVMQLTTRPKQALLVRADIAEKLMSWQHGELRNEWFTKQLHLDPPQTNFSVPLRDKVQGAAHDSWAWAQLFGVLAAAILALKPILQSAKKATD